MTTGTWNPTIGTVKNQIDIDPEVLRTFVKLGETDQLESLLADITPEVQMQQRGLMKLAQQQWIEVSQQFSNTEIEHLIRFFTLAEMQLPGWESGEKSPVIGLVKSLKLRNAPPEKELVLWIKKNSSNRFLPNGAL